MVNPKNNTAAQQTGNNIKFTKCTFFVRSHLLMFSNDGDDDPGRDTAILSANNTPPARILSPDCVLFDRKYCPDALSKHVPESTFLPSFAWPYRILIPFETRKWYFPPSTYLSRRPNRVHSDPKPGPEPFSSCKLKTQLWWIAIDIQFRDGHSRISVWFWSTNTTGTCPWQLELDR